jgi:hypothetical protein
VVRDIQALRSFLKPTSDSSPAMMPSSHSGLVGTGVALDGGVSVDGGGVSVDGGVPEGGGGVPYVGGGVPEGGGGGATVSGAPTTNGSLVADAGLSPTSLVAVTAQVYDTPLVRPETAIGEVGLAPKSNLSPEQ